jgi:glycosyltransferase involved in cell wall biosynthesis
VVDDGSTDDTAEVAAAHRAQCIRQENRGLPAARNTGLRASSGEAVLFLDADDVLEHDAVAAAVACLGCHTEAAFAFGCPRIIGLPSAEAVPDPVESNFYEELLKGNYIMMPGLVLYRRSILEGAGGFDGRLEAAEDYDLYLRITRRFPVVFCADMRGRYRRHVGNMSNDSMRMFRATSAVLRSQRKHVWSSRARRRAYRLGKRTWRQFYGRWAILDVREQIGHGKIKSALPGLATLLRYDPPGFAGAVLGGLKRAIAVRTGRDSTAR